MVSIDKLGKTTDLLQVTGKHYYIKLYQIYLTTHGRLTGYTSGIFH
jgi:hypothetical protein